MATCPSYPFRALLIGLERFKIFSRKKKSFLPFTCNQMTRKIMSIIQNYGAHGWWYKNLTYAIEPKLTKIFLR